MHGGDCAGLFVKQLFLYYGKCVNGRESFHNTVIDCLPICCVRRVYKYEARRRPLYLEIYLFLTTLLRCRRLRRRAIGVGRAGSEAYVSSRPCTG